VSTPLGCLALADVARRRARRRAGDLASLLLAAAARSTALHAHLAALLGARAGASAATVQARPRSHRMGELGVIVVDIGWDRIDGGSHYGCAHGHG